LLQDDTALYPSSLITPKNVRRKKKRQWAKFVLVCLTSVCDIYRRAGKKIFFFPGAKNSFPVVPKGQKTPPGNIFEN
jgi:hypothetical protein